MKKIILTFDYELFLGQSGSIEKCILEPSNSLLKLFNEYGIKAVFFVDVLCLQRLKEQGLVEDYNKIKRNIQELLQAGNSIELHLHPHWIDAKYDNKSQQWDLSNDRYYRFQDLSSDYQKKIFREGTDVLYEICREVKSNYKITSFRAGGLCIQPFTDFKDYLMEHKINIESSVAPGLKNDIESQKIDFSMAAITTPYRFNEDPCVAVKNGRFLEFPIGSYQISFIEKIQMKLTGQLPNHIIFGDGSSAKSKNSTNSHSVFDRIKSSTYLYSLDGDFYPEILFKKLLNDKSNIITMICHPKLLSKNSIEFIKKMCLSNKFSFSTFEEEYTNI